MRPLLIAVLALLALAESAVAGSPVRGTSDAKSRQDAQRQIPYDKLSAEARQKVDAVLADVTIFRRLPTQVFRCDPDLFFFMTTHPDVTVNVWEALKLSTIRVARTGKNTFRADDGAGTKSDLQYLYTSHDTQVIYAVGNYQGPLFASPVRGGCLLLLKTGYIREPDGHYYVTARLDAFFRIDHLGAELITKTFQSLVNNTADKNIRESAAFLRNLSLAAEIDPDYMRRLSKKLTKVRAEDRRGFAEVTSQAARRASRARIRRASHLDKGGARLSRGEQSSRSK